ncbi:hypothetical protein SALBM135S_00821 [Streptomyces alboniger]
MVTAAMGLRAMSVTLTNCGTGVREVNGYPDIRVRGLDKQLFAVTVLKGTEPVTTMDDPGPGRVHLRPGESAYTSLVWRYSAVDAATRDGSGVYVDIAPAKGTPAQTIEDRGRLRHRRDGHARHDRLAAKPAGRRAGRGKAHRAGVGGGVQRRLSVAARYGTRAIHSRSRNLVRASSSARVISSSVTRPGVSP